MIIRIVRMSFHAEHTELFQEVFNTAKEKIRAFEGCNYLELWQDANDPSIFMTHSHWDSEEALNNYRHSELFKSTWAKTKPLFNVKPVAFSANSLMRLP